MVDFANSNLCGASPEFNKLASQFDSIKDILANNLETDAAALASLLDTSLTTLEVNLRGLIPEIPTVPKLNLQSEITSLISLPAGSPSFLSAFAEIELEFGDDIKAKGLELESLVTSATSAILGGGNCCALVPNLEKEAGSLLAAVQNAPGVKQAAENAITEASAVVNQNVDIEAKVVAVKEKITSYKVTNTPPTEDTGAYTVAEETKKISVDKTVVAVTDSGQNSNVASPKSSGFVQKRNTKTELLTFDDLQISGYSITFKNLKHKPVKVTHIHVHPPASADILQMPKNKEIVLGRKFGNKNEMAKVLVLWQKERSPPYYTSAYGPHMRALRTGYSTKINEDGSVTTQLLIGQNEMILDKSYVKPPEGNHPGNITSVYAYSFNFKKLEIEESTFAEKGNFHVLYGPVNPASGTFIGNPATRSSNDEILNKRFKDYAAVITYDYLDNYNAEVKT